MSWATLFINLVRVSLVALPVLAIALTALNDLAVFTILAIMAPLLLRGFGYDILEYAYSLEIDVWVQLYVYMRIAPHVEHTWDAFGLWFAVVLISVVFTAGKTNATLRFYFNEFIERDKETHKPGFFSLESNESYQRKQVQPVSVLNRVLLVTVFGGASAARIFLDYSNLDDVSFYADCVSAVVLVVICVRASSLTLTTNITEQYSSLFLILLLIESSYLWLNDVWSYATYAEIFFGLVVLVLIFEQTTKLARFSDAILVGIKELVFLLLAVIKTQPASLVGYVVLSFTMFSLVNNELYQGHSFFPPIITAVFCPVKDFVDEDVKQLFQSPAQKEIDDALGVLNNIMLPMKASLLWFIQRMYPWVSWSCLGPVAIISGTNGLLSFVLFTLPLIPCIPIMLSFIIEAQRVLRSTSFWVISGVVVFVCALMIQVVIDMPITVLTVFGGVTYTRTYSWDGVAVIACQIGMITICMWQFLDRRKILASRTTVTRQIIDKSEKVINLFQAPSVILMASGFIGLVYLFTFDGGPIEDISVGLRMDDSLPEWAKVSPFQKLDTRFPSIAYLIGNLFSGFFTQLDPVKGFFQELEAKDVCDPSGEFCLVKFIEKAFGGIGNLVTQGLEAALRLAKNGILNALQAIPGNPLRLLDNVLDGLPSLDPVFDLAASINLDLSFMDGLFGMSFGIPPLLRYGFVVICLTVLLVGVVILFYYPEIFVEMVTNLILGIFATLASVFGIYFLYGYWLFGLLGLEPVLTYSDWLWWYLAATLTMVVGFLWAKYDGDEKANEALDALAISRYRKI